MIDWTNTHFRVWMRILAPHSLLYTEMQTCGAIKNNPARSLYFQTIEHPIALQLGGADPHALVDSALRAQALAYDEVNLNLGCPSDKVQAGRFGACLMKEPKQVVACIRAMKQVLTIPVSAKTRIGIDEQDSYEFFRDFIYRLVDAGLDKLIVHARKAWLHGLNPKQNRTVPPINYEFVYKIKDELPHLPIVINGDIKDIVAIKAHLQQVDGVMLGRLACDNPYQIALIHHDLYPDSTLISRATALQQYYAYMLTQQERGVPLSVLVKPLFNIAHGQPGAGQWKQLLMKTMQTKDLSVLNQVIHQELLQE